MRDPKSMNIYSGKNIRGVRCAFEAIEPRLFLSTYTVNTLSDSVNQGRGVLTLRQAVEDANTHPGANTITFDPEVFASTSLHTITLQQGEIVFSNKTGVTTVDGPGANVLAVNGGGLSRDFQIDGGVSIAVSGVTVRGGKATDADSSGNTYGGGILNNGTLTLVDCTVTSNDVTASGYSVSNPQAKEYIPGYAMGGGIYSTGELAITSSTISDNQADNVALAIYQGNVALQDPGAAFGGGIYSTKSVSLFSDMISENSVAGTTAANGSSPTIAGAAAGGGIYDLATVNIQSSTVSGNVATGGSCFNVGYGGDASGGGIYSSGDLIISGGTVFSNSADAGSSGFSAGGSGIGRGGGIYSSVGATITQTNISGNHAKGGTTDTGVEVTTGMELPSAGGGLFAATSATLSFDVIDDNGVDGGPGGLNSSSPPSGAGGGVYGGTLTILDTSVVGNQVTASLDQDVSMLRFGGLTVGGGIATIAPSSVTGSTIADNSVAGGSGYNSDSALYSPTPGGDGQGGGIDASSTLTITNSTIAGNTAAGGAGGDGGVQMSGSPGGNGEGGAIYSTSQLVIADCTVSGNAVIGGDGGTAPAGPPYLPGTPGDGKAGGIDAMGSSPLITNSIISANKAANAFSDIAGTVDINSANDIIGVGGGLANGNNGNETGVDNPLLSQLGNYGGPTETMLPLIGSPAISAGSAALIPKGIITDQRGFARITNKKLDIGAAQFGNATITGSIFNDEYATGQWQKGDPGLAGFAVYLDLNNDGQYDANDISTVTNSNGLYSFADVPAGTYAANIVSQRTYRLTAPSILPAKVVVSTGTTVAGPTFGETQDALISGAVLNAVTNKLLSGFRVYLDLNNDGKWESTEPSVVTGSNGQWSFNIPSPGTYRVRIVAKAGYETTAPTGGVFTFVVGKASARIDNVFSEELAI